MSKVENPKTIKTLHWMVKQDIGVIKYKDIIKENLSQLVITSIQGEKQTGAHNDVANVVQAYYKNEYVCSGQKENYWFFWLMIQKISFKFGINPTRN